MKLSYMVSIIFSLTVCFLITSQIWVPSNPHGAERLPPGMIEAESDFYLRRLWGNPSEVRILPSLVICIIILSLNSLLICLQLSSVARSLLDVIIFVIEFPFENTCNSKLIFKFNLTANMWAETFALNE